MTRVPYADELLRVSTVMLKVQVGPKRWRSAKSIHLESDGYVADVQLMDVASASWA